MVILLNQPAFGAFVRVNGSEHCPGKNGQDCSGDHQKTNSFHDTGGYSVPGTKQEEIPHREYAFFQNLGVPKAHQPNLEDKLAAFLKKTRGETSYAEFAKKTGLTPSTLFRLENRQQSITIGRLEDVMARLKVTLQDIFG